MTGDPLGGEPISVGHAPFLQARFAEAGKRAWCYFAPFLCSYSLPPGRTVYVAEVDGALVLPVKSEGRRGRRTDLVVPPLPMAAGAVDDVMNRLAAMGGTRPPRIQWVDGDDAAVLDPDRYILREKEAEYYYDPGRVHAASGRDYRDLRKRVNRFRRERDHAFREMRADDVPACESLHRRWRSLQGRKRSFLLDWGYTRAALASYDRWEPDELRGWCVEVEGVVAAFAMAGPMLPDQASFFVAKADPGVLGLSEYLRWRVMGELADFDRVNDAGDLGLPGLRQAKRKLRPVAEEMTYTAVRSDDMADERAMIEAMERKSQDR